MKAFCAYCGEMLEVPKSTPYILANFGRFTQRRVICDKCRSIPDILRRAKNEGLLRSEEYENEPVEESKVITKTVEEEVSE